MHMLFASNDMICNSRRARSPGGLPTCATLATRFARAFRQRSCAPPTASSRSWAPVNASRMYMQPPLLPWRRSPRRVTCELLRCSPTCEPASASLGSQLPSRTSAGSRSPPRSRARSRSRTRQRRRLRAAAPASRCSTRALPSRTANTSSSTSGARSTISCPVCLT